MEDNLEGLVQVREISILADLVRYKFQTID